MKNLTNQPELSPEAVAEIQKLTRGVVKPRFFEDNFGIDDSWLDEFIEDYNF